MALDVPAHYDVEILDVPAHPTHLTDFGCHSHFLGEKDMRSRRVIQGALIIVAVVLCYYCALAQSQPQGQKKQESPRERLKNYYAEGEEKAKSFTYKDQPAFKVYKPSKNWHFIDMARYHGDQAKKARTQQQAQQIASFFKLCKCIMHNGELKSEAAVIVSKGVLRGTLDKVMQEMEFNLKKSLSDYKRISCKGKKKNKATGACLVFEGTPKGQAKDTYVWYFMVRDKSIYQLRMACESEQYKKAKKDFDKIYKKWKF